MFHSLTFWIEVQFMSTLAIINTSEMFTSIRESRSTGSNYLSDRIHAHYCTKCGQVFTAKFDFIPSMGWQRWSGDYFVCPRCGKHQYRNYLTVSKENDTCGEWLPTSLRIILYEFKKHLRHYSSTTRLYPLEKTCRLLLKVFHLQSLIPKDYSLY